MGAMAKRVNRVAAIVRTKGRRPGEQTSPYPIPEASLETLLATATGTSLKRLREALELSDKGSMDAISAMNFAAFKLCTLPEGISTKIH